jgi:hypothetical protein
MIFLPSCKKVIDLDLKDSDPKFVIEGVVTNEPGTARVLISMSKNFNESNQFEGVSGAIVKISDNGIDFMLSETSPGVYQNNTINGTPGHVYDLSVEVAGKIFTATSTMPQPVLLDTLYISTGPFGQFKFPTIAFTDPAGIDNGYRFIQYLNGVKDPAIFWEDDEFTDGQLVISQLDSGVDKVDDPRNIKTGDQVRIEMLGVDTSVLRYWYTLSTGGARGVGNVVAPSNPITNIHGGALGYFSAQTINSRTVIAP